MRALLIANAHLEQELAHGGPYSKPGVQPRVASPEAQWDRLTNGLKKTHCGGVPTQTKKKSSAVRLAV